MASEIDIANLALSRLGDSATVASFDPAEGSVQAEHCARFYPIARDTLLEMHPWAFATKRVQLALLGTPSWTEWSYYYAMPEDYLGVLAVLSAEAPDDYSMGVYMAGTRPESIGTGVAVYTPQPYTIETDELTGAMVLYTHQENAVLRYNARVTDTTKFSPTFTDALAWLLASHLAGPVLKGDAGMAMAQKCMQAALTIAGMAMTSDASDRRAVITHSVPWVVNR